MRDSVATKEKILKHSGALFNKQGYKATSLSDITDATGLTKGAIYRHFKNKEKLEEDTLLHLSNIMFTAVRERIKAQTTAPAKLNAILNFFESYISKPPVPGGCPLQNVAIEADDTDPRLRKKAIGILGILHEAVSTIITNGIRFKQLKQNTDSGYHATIIIASLEGAIMMSKLRGNDDDIKVVVKHLSKLIDEISL